MFADIVSGPETSEIFSLPSGEKQQFLWVSAVLRHSNHIRSMQCVVIKSPDVLGQRMLQTLRLF